MNEIDRLTTAALVHSRAMLRKLPHWRGALWVSSVSSRDTTLVYAALATVPRLPDADADEVVYVEESRLPVDSPEFAWPSAARWPSIKRVDRALLVTEPERCAVDVDGVSGEAFAWRVGAHKLVVTVRNGLRYEVWAASDLDVVLVPLADTDTVELSWLSRPEGAP